MFRLRDFIHLPQADALLAPLVSLEPGLVLVAGLDVLPAGADGAAAGGGFLPAGRATLFRTLFDETLAAFPAVRAQVVTRQAGLLRISKDVRSRVRVTEVRPPLTCASAIRMAAANAPLLVIDHLDAESAAPALAAAAAGARVLAQIDTPYQGRRVAAQLAALAAADPPARLDALRWILSIERLPTLCPHCRQPAAFSLADVERLGASLAALSLSPEMTPRLSPEHGTFFTAPGCPACTGSGRLGDVAVFDLFGAAPASEEPLTRQPSQLPAPAYAFHLAAQGLLSLDDFYDYEFNRFQRAIEMYFASEQAQVTARRSLETKLLELETANRVLRQRTGALFSLQELGQALISPAGLNELAQQVGRQAQALCGADRVMVYSLRRPPVADILAAVGWEAPDVAGQVDLSGVAPFDAPLPSPGNGLLEEGSPVPFRHSPPGLSPARPVVERILAGLAVPLLAQGERVGWMLVQSTRKREFSPAETAMVQAFANQAALAFQRAGLVEALQARLAELEAAQAELAKKERLEREMELARQVQQSILPQAFPAVPGYQFAARNLPARRVGGDFYDVVALDGDTFALAVADVSDKGIPAALYMALTRSLLRAEARRTRSPKAVLENVATLLAELGEPGMFVTVFYAVVDARQGMLTYARAGHDRPLLLRDGGLSELPGQGTPLGLLPPGQGLLEEHTCALQPGDRLVLYTDGLTDVLNLDGALFNLDRLKAGLLRYAAAAPPEMVQAILADLAAFQGAAEQYDDMTILVLGVDSHIP